MLAGTWTICRNSTLILINLRLLRPSPHLLEVAGHALADFEAICHWVSRVNFSTTTSLRYLRRPDRIHSSIHHLRVIDFGQGRSTIRRPNETSKRLG